MELSSPKKILIFQEELPKPQKQITKLLRRNFLSFVSCDVFVIFTTVKQREIPCEANLSII